MIFEVVVACVHMAEKRGHKHPYAAWRCYWELWLLEDKLPQCKGDVHTVRGAIGSRCGEAISQILLWNVVGSRGFFFFQSLARPASPALTHHRAQEQTPFFLPLSIMCWETLTLLNFACELEAVIFQSEKPN